MGRVTGRMALWVILSIVFCACGQRKGGHDSIKGDTLTAHARLLTIVDAGAYRVADILNPWDTAEVIQRLVLYPRGAELPDDAPDGVRIETPVRNTVVFTSVHCAAIKELGALDAVKGVADAPFVKIAEVADGLRSGKITDVGSSMSPSYEQIMMVDPDVVLVSPYEGDLGLQHKGANGAAVSMADWMESTPLGRAEWILLLGELYGEPERARGIFDAVVKDYNDIAKATAAEQSRPKVLTECLTDGVWYVPGGGSYMARLIADAGGLYPWGDDRSAGSLPLSMEQVYDRAADSDVWLIKTYGYDLSLDDLGDENPVYRRFKAYADGRVYGCNTAESTLFEDFPFHPERLLRDYFLIFHPEHSASTEYYHHAR